MRRIIAGGLCLAVMASGVAAAAGPSSAGPSESVEYRLDKPASGKPDSIEYQPDQPPGKPTGQEEKPGFFDVEERIKKAISDWFAELVRSPIEPVFKVLGSTIFATPQIDGNQRVKELWRCSLAIADAGLVLFVLVGAGMITISSDIGAQLSVKEAFPRFLLAAGASNVSLVLLKQMISLSNALSRGLLSTLDGRALGEAFADRLFYLAFTNVFFSLLCLFVIVIGVLVAIVYVVRIAILVVVNAAAPLLLMTHALSVCGAEEIRNSWPREAPPKLSSTVE